MQKLTLKKDNSRPSTLLDIREVLDGHVAANDQHGQDCPPSSSATSGSANLEGTPHDPSQEVLSLFGAHAPVGQSSTYSGLDHFYFEEGSIPWIPLDPYDPGASITSLIQVNSVPIFGLKFCSVKKLGPLSLNRIPSGTPPVVNLGVLTSLKFCLLGSIEG